MPKLTHKSQVGRKPKCRDCFVDMELQPRLITDEYFNADWVCPKCERMWPTNFVEKEKTKRAAKHSDANFQITYEEAE